jgi:hypothetical protein
VEEYIRLLKMRASKPDNIRARPFSGQRDSRESLIAVYCTGKDFKGEGHVNVSVPEGQVQDYQLRLVGMINIALASSNIPDGITKDGLAGYSAIIDFIKSQYKALSNRELALPGAPEDLLKAVRLIVFDLPKSSRANLNKIEEYNKAARQALSAA